MCFFQTWYLLGEQKNSSHAPKTKSWYLIGVLIGFLPIRINIYIGLQDQQTIVTSCTLISLYNTNKDNGWSTKVLKKDN